LTSVDLSVYEVVLFDLDSTLTNTQNYPFEASEWLLSQLTNDSSEILTPCVRSLFGYYREGIEEVAAGGIYRSPTEVIRRAVLQSLEDIGLEIDTGTLDNALKAFKQLHIDRSIPVQGMEDLLMSIKGRGIGMGVFTNSFQGNAKTILENHGLAHYFDIIADGADVSAFKPMAQAFEYMTEKMDALSSSCLYVGDEYYSDVVGATSAGMSAVWINRRGRSLEKNIQKYGTKTAPILVLESAVDLVQYFG
jgi:putative hydrolase of the HAD superfamily